MPMTLDIVTVERSIFHADDVDVVVVPGTEGVMGILPRHAPVVTALKEGVLEIVRGGNREVLAIGGGFMEVRESQVVILAEAAEHADEIDVARAEAARVRARQVVEEAPDKQDMEKAMAALRRAEVRLRVSRKRSQQATGSH
jgi:F-type H+-transporting ATPase subunit epsilon